MFIDGCDHFTAYCIQEMGLNSEMFPTLPSINEVTMDMAKLGDIGAEMPTKDSSSCQPNSPQSEAVHSHDQPVPEAIFNTLGDFNCT